MKPQVVLILISIATATNQFSPPQENRDIGFCSVYKTVLPRGDMVAVQRYSLSCLDLSTFKSANILLYEKWTANLSEFGKLKACKSRALSVLYVDDTTALEIVHGLHIEQALVSPPTGDFDGLRWRSWATWRSRHSRPVAAELMRSLSLYARHVVHVAIAISGDGVRQFVESIGRSKGDVSINCGSNGASAARNGRQWLGDVRSKLSSSLQINGKSTTSIVTNKLALDDPIPHKTARISRSQFSYAIQVDPGQKIIRLHFNPSPYKGFIELKDFFTVQSGHFTFLRNFSASFTANALGVNTFAKEFCVNIKQNQQLTITFTPETRQSLDTYAFINGIEILVVPAALSYFDGGDIGLQAVGEKSTVYVDNNTALEMIQRINIKHDPVLSNGNSDTMFPKWATQDVDKKKSSTWNIPVEVGFRYLVRLHFSELGLKIAGTGELIFKVLINDMIAQTNSDILTASDGNYFLLFRDYILMMPGLKTDGKRDISISIFSHDELRDGQGVLAGFEIVKLSNHDNSLASPNPVPPPRDSPSKSISFLLSVLGHLNATSTIALTIISMINIIVYKLRAIWEGSSTGEEIRPSDRAQRLFPQFSLGEMQLATRNFNEGLVVGKGGFGKVYKGLIRGKDVAIKRLKSNSNQGAREFLTEIETLSELQHINLVSLIGYCKESREMILVYEYMPNGTLADHLYKIARRNRSFSSLTWMQRLSICIEAGRGLDYLHTGHRIIHRDVKASNILLDENFVAKVSDFGLAKREDRSRLQSHVSTKVKGTLGYFDPYYMTTKRLTKKSDTYAFGVVLFEVLCGRPAIDSWVLEEERVLIMWVRDKISKAEVEEIVDLSLRQEILPDSLKTFVEVAEKCLHDEPKNRPTMSQVVQQLEFALEQQVNRILALPNQIAPVASNGSLSNEDIIALSESAERSRRAASAYTQSDILSPTKVTNLNYSPIDSSKEFRKPKKCNLLQFLACCAFWCRRRAKPPVRKEFSLAPGLHEADTNLLKIDQTKVAAAANQYFDLCRKFSLHEIEKATDGFNVNYVISRDGFGNVYKGQIDDGATTVAIKRFKSSSNQGANEFENEIQILSRLKHRHLVSLIGYCDEKGEMIIVFTCTVNGTLRNHLHNSRYSPLTWKQRLEICLGAAKGLDYLHTGAEHVIIHRDVKTNNILLDEKLVAKMYNFGLSKGNFDSDWDQTHFSSGIKGTFGYLDPEYYNTGRLTIKSDVYSFGVVLFEVLCGRPAVVPNLPRDKASLILWGTSCFRKGKVDKIIDSNLKGQIAPECLNKFVETAVACLSKSGNDRPTMRDVIGSLEFVMNLQNAANIDDAKVAANQSLDLCRYFSLHEIIKATDGFNVNYVISSDGFGNVYKGLIDDGATTVAIKKLAPSSNQGAKELATEIEMLSRLRHHHLVSLIGYCHGIEEMIIVYDYMARGSLRQHLYNSGNPPLTWNQRLKICLGAAKGLDYLHTGTEHVIIHRDVNTTNILLDEKWVAKMYDFGLSKGLCGSESDQTHVSTQVKGTFGYLDPDYFRTLQVTVKSDVYSFGVVLFEVLCARPVIIPSLPRKQVNLSEWGISCFRRGKLEKVIDSNLQGQIEPGCLNKFVETAVACLSNRGIDRPTMREVIGSLESAMQLQEAAGLDEAPTLPWMAATTSCVDLKESKYEPGLESRRTQKAKLLPLSSAKQSDDSFSFS
ncbi:Malectin/receptor-like protein kinase family protein [Perilla frutescens var. hirtella]|nr:Malectin/receptor-like protein kinase family protein [Perilla frutescens var. hirtella]